MHLGRRHVETKRPEHGRHVRAFGGLQGLFLWSILTAALAATAAHAEDAQAAALPKHELDAKMRYCEVCHGPSARGFVGYYPVPRLAGQQVEYLENQLKSFSEQKRANNIMFNVGHVLSPAMITALANGFHDLNPPPLRDAPSDQAAAGKKIFEDGISDSNVPPCATCHGADAKGNGEFPRLAGQLYPYIVKQLSDWSKERHEEASTIMEPIAHGLTLAQIKAVAAYVNGLE
jgi:cytochrome c553